MQTVSELTINQMSQDQYLAEKAAGRINAGEVYACTPSPVKWEDIQNKPDVSGGGDVDFQELARRIPSWQWKVTMPKTVNQTVTATVGSQTYTSDFYAPQGSTVIFSAKADPGYIAGNLSIPGARLNSDLTVTVTAATESENLEAGTKTFYGGREAFIVPPKVRVLKWTWAEKDIYTKVVPGKKFNICVYRDDGPGFDGIPSDFRYNIVELDGGDYSVFSHDDSNSPLSIAWSKEINEHTYDYDWSN